MDPNPLVSFRAWFVRNWKWAIALAFGFPLLLLAFLLSTRSTLHVGNFGDDESAAVELIRQFHARINAGRFDEIYDDADAALKASKNRETLVRELHEAHDKYGQFQRVTSSEVRAIAGAPIEVRARYDSVYEKGDATELFSFLREGHKLQLAFYQITNQESGRNTEIQTAQRAADEFYRRLASGEYDAIFDDMSGDLKTIQNREETRVFFQGINDKFGECQVTTLESTDYARNTDGHFVGLVYSRECTGGEHNERLAFRIVNGKALLRGYH
jgi:hypothetical protein